MQWSLMVFPPLAWLIATLLGTRWALREHRKERKVWHDLFERAVAGATSGLGVVEGTVAEAEQVEAPFSGRPCVASYVELIGRVRQADAWVYRRLRVRSEGSFVVTTADGEDVTVEFERAQPILPPALEDTDTLAASIRAWTGSGDRAPERVQAWVTALEDEALWNEYFNPSRDTLFKAAKVTCVEHRIEPGRPVTVIGAMHTDEVGRRTVHAGGASLFFGRDTLEAERRRVQRLPIVSEFIGALLGGLVVAGLVGFLLSSVLASVAPEAPEPVEAPAP